MTQGVFLIRDVYKLLLDGQWATVAYDPPPPEQPFGWYAGGSATGFGSTRVERITYASDTVTATVRGPLDVVRNKDAATGSSNFGWFGGGLVANQSASTSSVSRISYASDSSTAAVRGPLSLARNGLTATGGFPG